MIYKEQYNILHWAVFPAGRLCPGCGLQYTTLGRLPNGPTVHRLWVQAQDPQSLGAPKSYMLLFHCKAYFSSAVHLCQFVGVNLNL